MSSASSGGGIGGGNVGDGHASLSRTVSSSHAPDATRASLAPTLMGISAAGFAAVIEMAGGRDALAGKSTDWLKTHFVLPTSSAGEAPPCRASACAAAPSCELGFWQHPRRVHAPGCGSALLSALAARADSAQLVGTATAFLSHAYDYPFLDVADALAAWEARRRRSAAAGEEARVFFYFDLFVVNQHSANAQVSFSDLRDEFSRGVCSVPVTLFLLDGSPAPRSLARSWCIFEVATALKAGRQFEVVLPPSAEPAFLRELEHDFDAILARTSAIDAERATSQVPEDKLQIDRMIAEELSGFGAVDTLLIDALQAWVRRMGGAALEALPAEERASSALRRELAHFLLMSKADGSQAAAERELRETLSACRDGAKGGAHLDTLLCMARLGKLLTAFASRPEEGEPLLREALTGLRRLVGSAPGTEAAQQQQLRRVSTWLAQASAWHAFALRRLGRPLEAEALARETLQLRRSLSAYGPAHPETCGAMVDLASLLAEEGRSSEAEPLFLAALSGYEAALGASHPNLLWARSERATALSRQARHGECAAELQILVTQNARRYGEDHDETRSSRTRLADAVAAAAAAAAPAVSVAAAVPATAAAETAAPASSLKRRRPAEQ